VLPRKTTTDLAQGRDIRIDLLRPAKSGAQTLAAFGPTGIDNSAAGAGAHAGTETMSAFAFEVTGLECSFHG